MDKVPGFVDAPTRAQIEVDLVRTAVGVGPKELKNTADRTLFLLDQDGPEPDEHERARKRGVSISKQRPDATTTLAGISPPKRRPSGRRSSPSTPPRACATPTTRTPAPQAHRHKLKSTTTTAAWPSAAMTP